MIPAPHGKWFARFKEDEGIAGGEEFSYAPVVAWGTYNQGEEYAAMVPDMNAGDLIPANTSANFAGLCDAAEVELAGMSPEEIRERNKRMRGHR